jgi:hypothetical protein
MWTINKMEQLSPFGGVPEMSHRDEPRSGRGCFGAVVVVPFLALGGMFALIALTGSPDEAPRAAPPPARPTAQWWTEPFETGSTLATVTETVVVEGQAREVRAARLATSVRPAAATVTETVRVSGARPPVAERNEVPDGDEEPGEVLPAPSSSSPVVTSSSVRPGPPTLETPVASVPAGTSAPSAPGKPTGEVPAVPTTPRAEDPVSSAPVVPTTPAVPVQPPCERGEPSLPEEPAERSESAGEVSVGAAVELPLASPAEVLATSSAPLAGA